MKKTKKTPFMRAVGALGDIRKMMNKEVKKHYKLGAKAHDARFDSAYAAYEYGFAVGRLRQARETISLVTKIVEKM
jgi:hypothetical protein